MESGTGVEIAFDEVAGKNKIRITGIKALYIKSGDSLQIEWLV